MWIFKDFPLNFKVNTWRFSQWVATISYIALFIVFKDQYFGSLNEYTITFTTPLGIVALIASLVAQLYVYGGIISNTVKDILIPAVIIVVVFIVELAFSYVMSQLEYTPQWDTYIIRYLLLLLQSGIQMWVYNDVEFLIISKEELNDLTGGTHGK